MVLLVVTVAVSFVDLGPLNTVIAMMISTAKATLILVFFMHLGKGSPLTRLFACVGFFWLGILITLAMSDYLTRH
jgi:cytochrome c oxidase subunit 4